MTVEKKTHKSSERKCQKNIGSEHKTSQLSKDPQNMRLGAKETRDISEEPRKVSKKKQK